ncbi:hypothetical protein DKP76_03265 [Falsochrobactrum shanghaiense]|uniref:Uncharacterized protein n=1 Tax=Falsochrobactrum shanghaiense TaxID=2201899 RepID=A0A316JDJ4_9HYPH|nr:hypothetical protein [Falsochrobactrum shanghaiense]PWL19574.1 hypothetical protein DKP76_03265 [Falsochrobactrum shanghaiense]
MKINFTASINREYSTINTNVKPNPDLVPPSIFPPYIAEAQDDFRVFVIIPPYPNMAAGDTINLNIAAGVTSAYEVTSSDVNDQIVVLLTSDSIPAESIKPGNKIPITYNVNNNDSYSDDNMSQNSIIRVADQYNNELNIVSIYENIFLDELTDDCLGKSRTVFASNNDSTIYKDISEAYLLITDTNNNYLYYDHFSTLEAYDNLIFLVDSMKLYRHAGEDVNVWIIAISQDSNSVAIHSTPVAKIKIPASLQISPAKMSYAFSCNALNIVEGKLDIIVEHHEAMESGDIIRVGLFNKNMMKATLFPISDNIIGRDIVIPYTHLNKININYFNNTAFSVAIIKKNINLLTNSFILNIDNFKSD